jgi:hypothetical protein
MQFYGRGGVQPAHCTHIQNNDLNLKQQVVIGKYFYHILPLLYLGMLDLQTVHLQNQDSLSHLHQCHLQPKKDI